MATNVCIYCGGEARSVEHPLIVALGEFQDAPLLTNRICVTCNGGKRLGLLDEQYARCGPESFLRRHYGIAGRPTHAEVNPFYRGSAGGQRLEMLVFDDAAGFPVLMDCENGTYGQARQLIFFAEDGAIHHLPIRADATANHLRNAYERLKMTKLVDVRVVCHDEEWTWIAPVIRDIWPDAMIGDRRALAQSYDGATVTVTVTDRYFRAIAKMGFHYFLTQFPEYCGAEPIFDGIRRYISEAGSVLEANGVVWKRNTPLLSMLAVPDARPDGWRGHVLAAEAKDGVLFAYVQTFLSPDWPAPIYSIVLGRAEHLPKSRGHLYVYSSEGQNGKYAGAAYDLRGAQTSIAPSYSPVIDVG